jgi:hypothetical protein
MFTQPSVNQIASTYQGNPAPLARKVDQDKKQNGGIPKDLRQLMALNDIAEGKQAVGIQQALQIPTNMPTVAQNTQQLAQQALQARMLQQVREQQRLQQKPPTLPLGTPQPEEQPQGIDSLETNVGTQYAAEGGIIGNTQHFQSKGSVQDPEVKKEEEATSDVGDFFRSIVKAMTAGREKSQALDTLSAERFAAAPGPFEALTPTQRTAREKQLATLSAQRDQVRDTGEIAPTYPKTGTPTFKTYAADSKPDAAEEAMAAENSKLFNLAATPSAPAVPPTNVGANKPSTQKTQGNTRVNVDTAPMPAGLQGLASSLATPGLDYQRKMLNQNENDLAAAKEALYLKKVGERDLSIYDRTAAELEARKQKLNAPKAGYDAMMEYLEQVALGGGRSSAESGSIGASRQRQLQLAREGKQNELMDKILELGAKKSDAQYAERKGMFELTQAEKDRVIKEKTEAAKQLGLSEDKTRELIEQGLQKELDRKNELKKAGVMSAANRDDLMNRALQIKAENPTISIEDAIKRASIATYAGQLTAAEGKTDAATEKTVAAIRAAAAKDAKYYSKDSKIYQRIMETMEKDIADARSSGGGAGLPSALPAKKPEGVTVTKIGS